MVLHGRDTNGTGSVVSVMSCKSSCYEPPLFSDSPCYADYAIGLHSITVFKYNTACVISRKPGSHFLPRATFVFIDVFTRCPSRNEEILMLSRG